MGFVRRVACLASRRSLVVGKIVTVGVCRRVEVQLRWSLDVDPVGASIIKCDVLLFVSFVTRSSGLAMNVVTARDRSDARHEQDALSTLLRSIVRVGDKVCADGFSKLPQMGREWRIVLYVFRRLLLIRNLW